VILPDFLSPELLRLTQAHLGSETYYHRVHDGIGREDCLEPGPATAALELAANDPELLQAVQRLAGCDTIRSFDGRIYRLVPGGDHYDSWHSDAGPDRLLGLSIDLSPERYEGGELELRRVGSAEPLFRGAHPRAGDAMLFRLSPDLEHRVGPVRGPRPRIVYAGWFRSHPDYWERLRARAKALHP
jgi:hypothetical protein